MRHQTPESQYIERHFAAHHPLLDQIKKELEKDQLDFMSVSAAEARFLQFFIKSFDVKSVVEIGSLYGYSAMAMALALPAGGRLHCFEKDFLRAQKIREFFQKVSLPVHMEVHSGEALEGLAEVEKEGPFDLIFIDANKSAYTDYLDWAEKHTRSGSLIIGDNTFLFGALWEASKSERVGKKQIEVMSRFNERLSDQSRYDSIIIPTMEGMTVARKK